ncbi:MAG: YaaA family protein [Dermatophilaceae bacterium]
MLILLPPSESKALRSRGRPADPGAWSFPALAPTRDRVTAALREVSAKPDAVALLGVPPTLGEEVARNLRLDSLPAASAGQVYSGVLYDALGLATMDAAARRRANRWIVVASALHGALRLRDRIAPYRLAMDVSLPGIGPLAAAWRPGLADVLPDAAGGGVVVDCRSATYVTAWRPTGDLAERWVQIRVPGASHLAKHTRGLVARHLCGAGAAVRTAPSLAATVGTAFDVELHEPARAGTPWLLDVHRPVA